jgi:phosphatidate cytidylyltransferase
MNRLITAVLLAIAACYLIFLSPPPIFKAAAVLVGLVCYREYSGLLPGHGIRRASIIGVITGALLILIPEFALLILALAIIAAFAVALRFDDLAQVLPSVVAEIAGALYTFLPWHFAEELRFRSIHWMFFATALNWFGDSVAYYAGRQFGRHPLAPIVSPKKTWEGAAASVLGSVIFGLVYLKHFEPSLPLWSIAVMAVVANVAGQIGDLTESALKRGAGVKDSGNILPGHGGLLDRVDSSLFAIPVVYALSLMFAKVLP